MKKAFKMCNPEAYKLLNEKLLTTYQSRIHASVAWSGFKQGWECGRRYEDNVGRMYELEW